MATPHTPEKHEVLHPSNPEDLARLGFLRGSAGQCQIYDTIREQLEDLLRARAPHQKWSPPDLDRAVSTHVSHTQLDLVGTWVHYPWSRRLVHILSEPDFSELRLDRNRNKITPEEQSRLRSLRIGIIGLSVGRSVATLLAQQGMCGELRLADFDTLGLSNLNRVRGGLHDLGLPKVELAAREIAEIDPYLPVRLYPSGLTEHNIDAFLLDGGKLDFVIEECDDLYLKFLVRERARHHRIAVLMDTSDGGLLDVERYDLEPTRPLFHGLVDQINPEQLRGLSTEDKIPFVLKIVEGDKMSPRSIASLLEVGRTLSTWPQLAADVTLGAAVTADTLRRIALGDFSRSGRFRVQPEQTIRDFYEETESPTEPYQVIEPSTAGATPKTAHPLRPSDQVRRFVAKAITAPTGGNTQPWIWRTTHDGVALHHDQRRSASFLDYDQGAAMMGLGAAIENLLLAARVEGVDAKLDTFPQGADPQVVAHISLVQTTSASIPEETRVLYEAIEDRCTNRLLGERREIPTDHLTRLQETLRAIPEARLQILTSPEQLTEIGEILGLGDRERFLSQVLHREMMSELRWTKEEAERSRNGIDLRTLELTAGESAGLRLCTSWPAMQMVRKVRGGSALMTSSIKAIRASSAVGLLTMPRPTHIDHIQGGRAMQRVWLRATSLGIALQPMSSLPYLFARLVRGRGEGMSKDLAQALAPLRKRYEALFELTPNTAEILLFRLAYAPRVSVRSLRRSVDDVWGGH